MPIVLATDPERIERLDVGGSVILHTRATGDEVDKVLRSHRDRATGETDHASAANELMERHVVGWENVLDAERNPVPFDASFVPQFVASLGFRERLLLDAAITSSFVEAAESGKDSAGG